MYYFAAWTESGSTRLRSRTPHHRFGRSLYVKAGQLGCCNREWPVTSVERCGRSRISTRSARRRYGRREGYFSNCIGELVSEMVLA